MMDVFYIEFRKKDELTTNVPLVDDVAVLKVITEAPRSKFFFRFQLVNFIGSSIRYRVYQP